MEKSIFIGINQDGDLVSLELNFNDLNKGTKFYNPHYYLTPHGYTDIKDNETGEQEARERLEDPEYWEEIGYLGKNRQGYNFLENHINFKEVAEEVLNSDGWQMTNGEYYLIGELDNKEYYINLNWIGFEEKAFSLDNFKKIFVSESDFNFLKENHKEVKEQDKKTIQKLKAIFDKEQNTKDIIKSFIEEKDK